MRQGRRLEIGSHPAPPAGLEVHRGGIRHEVQKGDSLYAIARDYSRAFHMDIAWTDVRDANRATVADGLHPGELLQIPGLEERTDSMFLSSHPRLQEVDGELRHVVARGDTLSAIARGLAGPDGVTLSWSDLYAANRDVIGADPNIIRPGQALRIPGITSAAPALTNRAAAGLQDEVLLTRTSRVQHETGDVDTIDIMSFRAAADSMVKVGTAAAAITAAQAAAVAPGAASRTWAVVQARDGAHWIAPLQGTEISDQLDDSDRTLSLAYRADASEVVAVVTREWGSSTAAARRYDR